MHGPGPSETPGTCSPTWSSLIPVVDKMVFTLRKDRRRIWREGRDKGLAQWAASGVLDFSVAEVRKPDQFTGENLLALMETDRLVLVRNAAGGGGDSAGWFDGAEPNPVRGGIAIFSTWKPWWKAYWMNSLVSLISHEIGHTLGFGHCTSGGVMGGTNKPSEHELDSLRSYYGS
jgi:hypothetical protein